MALKVTMPTRYGIHAEYHRIVYVEDDLIPPNPNPGVKSGVTRIKVGWYISEEARRSGAQPLDSSELWFADLPPKVRAARDAYMAALYEMLAEPPPDWTHSAPRLDPAGNEMTVQETMPHPAFVNHYNNAEGV
jgi:hypothetical protein